MSHETHCFQGEYATTCKYGEENCPMTNPQPDVADEQALRDQRLDEHVRSHLMANAYSGATVYVADEQERELKRKAVKRVGDQFHLTRLTHEVYVDPADLAQVLEAAGYYGNAAHAPVPPSPTLDEVRALVERLNKARVVVRDGQEGACEIEDHVAVPLGALCDLLDAAGAAADALTTSLAREEQREGRIAEVGE